MSFKLGDKVQWASQAGGSRAYKVGTIVSVVYKNKWPEIEKASQEHYALAQYGGGMPRKDVSYLVLVSRDGKSGPIRPFLYWPNASQLSIADS